MLDLNDTAPSATEGASAYLDHASTSPMPDEVLAAYARALQTVGNPASTHSHGQRASEALESARERIAAALGCGSAELVFTGGGTESINLALKGGFWARQGRSARPVILVADGEHHASIEAAEWLRDEQDAIVRWLPIDAEGRLAPETLAAAIAEENAGGADRVALISFLWANNEVGTVQPVKELCAIAAAAGIPVHVDAVAALGQIPVSLRDSGANLISVSAHKIGGPMGVGALVVDRRLTVSPLFHGGSQQRGRSGTQDVAGAIAFARAIELSLEADGTPRADRIARLTSRRDQLIAGVRAIDPTAVLRGADPATANRLAGSAHFTFPGCQGDSLVFLLDSAGVSVSVGSACRAGVAEVSHVLLAMGLPEDVAAGALRLTLSPDTAVAEIDAFLAALPIAIKRARVAGFV